VLTVCAGQPTPPRQGAWDRHCGFQSSSESIPARLREDDAAFAGSGHTLRRLELLEAQYLEGPRTEQEAAAVAAAVGTWTESVGRCVVALPVGAGRRQTPFDRLRARVGSLPEPPRHPDHVFVRDAAASALRARDGVTLAFYEELPYLLSAPGDREAQRLARRLGARATSLSLEVMPRRKAARLRAYESQMPHLVFAGRRLDDPSALRERERYWLLDRP
jgi:hypothetical protein